MSSGLLSVSAATSRLFVLRETTRAQRTDRKNRHHSRGSEGGPGNGSSSSLPSSCLRRDSCRRLQAAGPDEREQAGLLASRSSYWLRLTARRSSGLMKRSSLVTAALPLGIHTRFPILPRMSGGTCPRHKPTICCDLSKELHYILMMWVVVSMIISS